MKTHFFTGLLLALSLILAPAASCAAEAAKGVNWLSYDTARASSEGQAQKYFLYFSSENCGYCRMLENKTFSDPAVADYINGNYIAVQVDIDKERKVAARYRIQGVPDLRFLSKDGAVIGRWIGFTEAGHLLKLLKYIQTDSYLTMSFKEFTK